MSTKRDEDLFSPTLEGIKRAGEAEKPWRLDSQFWVAFFGGPVAAAVIAYLNAGRLAIANRDFAIATVAAAGLAVACAIAYAFVATGLDAGTRLASQMAGVLAYIPLYRVQRSADRIYRFYGDDVEEEEQYASLWRAGLAAVFFAGIPTVLLVGGIVTAVAD